MSPNTKSFKSKTGRTLSAKVQAFIHHCAETGNAADAIRKAGFNTKNPDNMGRQYRHRYRQLIEQAVTDRIEREQPAALNVIVQLSTSSDNDRVKLDAAKDILNRGSHLAGQRAEQARPEQTTAELIATMVEGMGAEATALALAKLNIPVPEYVTKQLHTKQPKPAIAHENVPVDRDSQGETDSLIN